MTQQLNVVFSELFSVSFVSGWSLDSLLWSVSRVLWLWFLWCRASYDEIGFVISCVLVHIKLIICSSLTRVAVLDFLWLILFHKMRISNQTRGVIIAARSLSGHTRQCDRNRTSVCREAEEAAPFKDSWLRMKTVSVTKTGWRPSSLME